MEHAPPNPPPIPSPARERQYLIPAWGFLHRRRHISAPLLVPVLALAAGAAAWKSPLIARAIVLAMAWAVALCVAFFARHKWDRAWEIGYAIGSGAAAAAWLTAATLIGVNVWMLIPLGALGLAWGIPFFVHKRPRAIQGPAKLAADWDAWWQHHVRTWDLENSGIPEVLTADAMEILVIQLWKGHQTIRNVENVLPLIESALGGYVPHGMLRAVVDRRDPSRVLLRLRRENPHGKAVTWDPSLVPASITQPAPIGVTEGGQPVLAPLLVNWFILGASRSGKSNELSDLLATLTAVPDARVWLIDRKGGRAARPWLPAVDWVATTMEESRILLATGAAETESRALNAYDGHEQLRPTEEVPAVFIVIDETHEVTSMTRGDTQCANLLEPIASMGMGVAVYVIVVTQYGALAESVRTEQIRMNLLNRMCFRVTKPEHGAFALSDWDKLNPARLENPGEFYWQEGPQSASEPARGYHMPHELVREIAAANGAIPRRRLVLYASAHQEAYDTRWSRLPAAFVPLAPQAQAVTPAPLPQRSQESAPVDIPPPAHDPIREAALAMEQRIEDEIAGTPDVDPVHLVMPDNATLLREVDRQKHRFALALQKAPEGGIPPRRLIALTGLSRSWVMQQLRTLTSDGAVIKAGEGTYRAAPGTDVWQAMEQIRERNTRLLADARPA